MQNNLVKIPIKTTGIPNIKNTRRIKRQRWLRWSMWVSRPFKGKVHPKMKQHAALHCYIHSLLVVDGTIVFFIAFVKARRVNQNLWRVRTTNHIKVFWSQKATCRSAAKHFSAFLWSCKRRSEEWLWDICGTTNLHGVFILFYLAFI